MLKNDIEIPGHSFGDLFYKIQRGCNNCQSFRNRIFFVQNLFMKRITIAICTLLLFVSCNNEPIPEKKTDTPPMDEAAMNKAMQEFSTPGDKHKWLASFNGTWDAEIISFMNPAKPDTSKATQTYSMTLNGLVQDATLTGNMMGMPFEGRSLTGYDNAKKKFVMTWVDNLSSGFTYMRGDYNDSTKTLHLRGTQTNAMNGRDGNIREVMKIINDSTYTLDMYGDGPDGKETKFMTGTFKRKS